MSASQSYVFRCQFLTTRWDRYSHCHFFRALSRVFFCTDEDWDNRLSCILLGIFLTFFFFRDDPLTEVLSLSRKLPFPLPSLFRDSRFLDPIPPPPPRFAGWRYSLPSTPPNLSSNQVLHGRSFRVAFTFFSPSGLHLPPPFLFPAAPSPLSFEDGI